MLASDEETSARTPESSAGSGALVPNDVHEAVAAWKVSVATSVARESAEREGRGERRPSGIRSTVGADTAASNCSSRTSRDAVTILERATWPFWGRDGRDPKPAGGAEDSVLR